MTPHALVFTVALLGAALATPLTTRLSRRLGLVAVPGGRRRHAGSVPRLGGLAVAAGFALAALLAWLLLPPTGDDALRLRGVLLGAAVMLVGGLIDDWRELSPRANLAVQALGAGIAMAHIVFVERFTNPLNGELVVVRPWALVIVVSLFWLLGMVNTVNFLDGLDGLATGVGTIAAALFAWHSLALGQSAVALFPLALAGALLGFLPFNFSPARIFLGAAGANFLGFLLATLSILAPAKIATALLVMAIPILDVAWQIYARWRRGQSPMQGDRGHLHFRLADAGLSTRAIVLGYYAVAATMGLVAIFGSAREKLALLAVLAAAAMGLFAWVDRRLPEATGVRKEEV